VGLSSKSGIYSKRATQFWFEIHHELVTKLYNDLGGRVVDENFLELIRDRGCSDIIAKFIGLEVRQYGDDEGESTPASRTFWHARGC